MLMVNDRLHWRLREGHLLKVGSERNSLNVAAKAEGSALRIHLGEEMNTVMSLKAKEMVTMKVRAGEGILSFSHL